MVAPERVTELQPCFEWPQPLDFVPIHARHGLLTNVYDNYI